MTKKEMIEILVKEESFNESELNDMLKSEVEDLFDSLFAQEEEEVENTLDEIKVEEVKEEKVAEEPKEEVSEEKEEIDISKLSKRERRSLARSSKI
jgi:hypothetical protein